MTHLPRPRCICARRDVREVQSHAVVAAGGRPCGTSGLCSPALLHPCLRGAAEARRILAVIDEAVARRLGAHPRAVHTGDREWALALFASAARHPDGDGGGGGTRLQHASTSPDDSSQQPKVLLLGFTDRGAVSSGVAQRCLRRRLAYSTTWPRWSSGSPSPFGATGKVGSPVLPLKITVE